MARRHFKRGQLVASTDKLKNIKGKRLNIQVSYYVGTFNNCIFKTETIGINPKQF